MLRLIQFKHNDNNKIIIYSFQIPVERIQQIKKFVSISLLMTSEEWEASQLIKRWIKESMKNRLYFICSFMQKLFRLFGNNLNENFRNSIDFESFQCFFVFALSQLPTISQKWSIMNSRFTILLSKNR